MPAALFGKGHRFLRREAQLDFEEIARVVAAAVGLGVRKVRLTGGEPLLRSGLSELVARLRPLVPDLALTTNGLALAHQASALRSAGLSRITISLDSLDPARFARLSGVGASLNRVLSGLAAARAAGFAEIKINTVVRRENLEEVEALARHFRGSGIIVRFIEFMDVGGASDWSMGEVVPARVIRERLGRVGQLVPVRSAGVARDQVAEVYRWADGSGEVGLIAAVSEPFCRDCVRLRLLADGTLYGCLFASEGVSLRPLLRSGASVPALMERLRLLWLAREDRYSELRGQPALVSLGPKVSMSTVGG